MALPYRCVLNLHRKIFNLVLVGAVVLFLQTFIAFQGRVYIAQYSFTIGENPAIRGSLKERLSNVAQNEFSPKYDSDNQNKLSIKQRLLNKAKYKGVYHIMTNGNNKSALAYFLNTYVDTRHQENEGNIIIRSVTTANFDLDKNNLYGTFWYQGDMDGLSILCNTKLGPPPLGKNAVHYGFYRYTMQCDIPKVQRDDIPEYVSLSIGKNTKPNNYIPVILPYPRDEKDPYKLGNCMQSLFGNFTDSFVFMFINWMEAIQVYGISEVTVNLNNFTNSPMGEKVLRHYQRSGVLKVTEYPDIVPENTNISEQTVGRIQSFIQLPFLDCFYRNINRYWYMIPFDTDELFVLKSNYSTYQEYLHYLHRNSTSNSQAVAITPKVAGYYASYRRQNESNSVPHHLELLTYKRRDKIRLLSHRKSFQNSRTCTTAGYHTCVRKDCTNCGYVNPPEEELVLHHYRHQPKSFSGVVAASESIYDPGIPEAMARRIKRRIEKTLQILNIPFDSGNAG